jgi:hypothetical protein
MDRARTHVLPEVRRESVTEGPNRGSVVAAEKLQAEGALPTSNDR